MKNRTKILIFTVFFVFVNLFTPFLKTVSAASAAASLSEVRGAVHVQKGGGYHEIDAFDGMKVMQGDWLTTGSDGWVKITYEDGTEATLGVNSKITIEQLTKSDTGQQVSMKIFAGRIWNKVKSLLNIGDTYEVETPTAIMGVRGTLFDVVINQVTGKTKTNVMEGVVAAADNKPRTEDVQEILVGMGQTLDQELPENKVQAIDPEKLIQETEPRMLTQMITDFTERVDEIVKTADKAQEAFKQTKNPELIKSAVALAHNAANLATFTQTFVTKVQASPKKEEVQKVLKETNKTLEEVQTKVENKKTEVQKKETEVKDTAKENGISEEEITQIVEQAPVIPVSEVEKQLPPEPPVTPPAPPQSSNNKDKYTPPKVVSVVIDPETESEPGVLYVNEGQTKTLSALVKFSDDSTNDNVIWSSDNPDIATVSETGVVTGVQAGVVKIMAKSSEDKSKKDVCVVYVQEVPVIEAGNVQGVVVDVDLPVVNANVGIENTVSHRYYESLTNNYGEFALNLPDGEYQVIDIDIPGGKAWIGQAFNVTSDNITWLDLQLPTLSIQGKLTNGDGETSLANLRVNYRKYEEGLGIHSYGVKTDNDGNFTLRVPGGDVWFDGVWLENGDWKSLNQQLTVTATADGSEQVIPYTLDLSAVTDNIHGILNNVTGPIADEQVGFINASNHKWYYTYTDDYGEFGIYLPAGDYNVNYNGDTGPAISVSENANENEQLILNVPFLNEDSVVISAQTKTIEAGNSVLIGVNVTNIPDPGLAGYDLTVNYDPNVIHVSNVTGTDAFALPVANIVYDQDGLEVGQVHVAAAQATGRSGNFLLFNLEAEAVGQTNDSSVIEVHVQELVDENVVDIPCTIANGTLDIGEAVDGPKVMDIRSKVINVANGDDVISILFDRDIDPNSAIGQQLAFTVTDDAVPPHSFSVNSTQLLSGTSNELLLILNAGALSTAEGSLHVAYNDQVGTITDVSQFKHKLHLFEGKFKPYKGLHLMDVILNGGNSIELTFNGALKQYNLSDLGWTLTDSANNTYSVNSVSLSSDLKTVTLNVEDFSYGTGKLHIQYDENLGELSYGTGYRVLTFDFYQTIPDVTPR